MPILENAEDIESLDLLASSLTPQLRSTLMEGLSDPIMRKIAFSLSQRMRCPVQLLSCVNGVISHDSALSALPDVMLAGIADMAPLHGRIIIAVEGDLVGAVVDAMFGATSSDFAARNELSAMEMRIGKQMIDLTLAGFTEVLSTFTTLDWSIAQHETAVNMLAIADKQDWMISTTGIFETALGIGSIRAIVPYSAFEPFEARINAQTWLIGPALVDRRWCDTMASLTSGTSCELIFDIARLQMPLGLIRRLEPGKILPILITTQATAHVQGLDILSAEYGQQDGLVCCRPSAMIRSENFLARAQRPLEKPKFPFFLPKVIEAQEAEDAEERLALDRVLLDVTVQLGEVTMTVGALEALRLGELIVLDKNAEASLAVLVEGRYFGEGEIVSLGAGRYGLRMVELFQAARHWPSHTEMQ